MAKAVTCTIYANQGWSTCPDSGGNAVAVQSGRHVSMSGAGAWATDTIRPTNTCGPAGYAANPTWDGLDFRYDTAWKWGALLWVVQGTSNDQSFSGTPGLKSGTASVDATVSSSGPLLFRINDTSNGPTEYNDPGSMDVTVTVSQ